MTKLLFICIIIASVAIAQEEKNPNVELPDFIITGQDVVSVRRVKKSEPEFISTVADKYLKPVLKPDELEVAQISNPMTGDLQLIDSANYYKGVLNLSAGRYTIPAGELNYAFPFTRGMLHGIVYGDNRIAFADNSERYSYGGALDFDYSLATGNNTQPGTKFKLGGKHTISSFKFYGSANPTRERKLNIGTAYLNISNLYLKQFIFDVNVAGDFTYTDKENYTESLLLSDVFGRLQIDDFWLNLKADYQKQFLTTDSLGNVNSDFYQLRPSITLELFDVIMADLGFTFNGSSSNKFNSLYASVGVELSDNLLLLGSYKPSAEFLTSGKFLRQNDYFNPQSYQNFLFKKKNYFEASVKYEYGKYFQINGGLRYFKSDEMPYYANPNENGIFELAASDVKSSNWFADFLFHPGPYGVFYGSAEFLNIRNSMDKKIPYYPSVKAYLSYGYNFNNGIDAFVTLYYTSKKYTDILNANSIPGFFDLALKFNYKIQQYLMLSFELQNILNRKVFIWEGYEAKPFDASLGISLMFN